MAARFNFETDKAIEAILYIAVRLPSPDFHGIFKTLYVADQDHLSRYGRLICGDRYIAMKWGPVPSQIYNMLKAVRGDDRDWFRPELLAQLEGAFAIRADRYSVQPLRDPDLDELSASDREALDRAIGVIGQMNFAQRSAYTHDSAWKSADPNDAISLDAIIDQLPNAAELREHLEREVGA